jgi:hypothetical protein
MQVGETQVAMLRSRLSEELRAIFEWLRNPFRRVRRFGELATRGERKAFVPDIRITLAKPLAKAFGLRFRTFRLLKRSNTEACSVSAQ